MKIKYYPEGERFLFQPSIGLDVRNRRQLLVKLAEYEREGLGGIPMSEVKEALHKPEKAVKVRIRAFSLLQFVFLISG